MADTPRYQRVSDIVSTDMDGERVMMSLDQGAYFGLGGIGGTIWDMLDQPRSIAELEAQVMTQYAVDAETCRTDVAAFLTDLERNGLVRTV